MVVYADILIVLNLIVNYFILLGSSKILRIKIKTYRVIIGAVIGAISSLYIFLPQLSIFKELIFKLSLCFIISALVFGIKSVKYFLKSSSVFFLVTCSYSGIMIAIWHIFKPNGMVINNSIIYFNISPIMLVCSCLVIYLLLSFGLKVFARTAHYAKKCKIKLTVGESEITFTAIIDTGNSVEDIFGKSQIIIADKTVINQLIRDKNVDMANRYRAIPFNTVSGCGLLDGYRCDKGEVDYNGKAILLEKPIIALSNTSINDGFSGIVNPKILD